MVSQHVEKSKTVPFQLIAEGTGRLLLFYYGNDDFDKPAQNKN